MGVTTSSNSAATYEPIATNTVSGSSTTSVSFTSIPSTYTDLILVVNGSTSSADQIDLRFNSDSGSNYSMTAMYGDGSSAASARATNTTYMYGGGWLSTTNSTLIIQFMNYANTTTYKTALWRGNATSNYVHAAAGLWRSTSAITQIDVSRHTAGVTFSSGTTMTLYGIRSA